jgi:hypothetical protein
MKTIQTYTNLLIVFVFLQIIYFLVSDSEIRKEHLNCVISQKGIRAAKLRGIILLLLLFIAIFSISSFLQNVIRINKYLISAFIAISINNYVDFKLTTNVRLSNIEQTLDEALKNAKTGDFVLFRSYYSDDIPEFLFFRYFNSLYSKILFSHIGMIVKENNETYIIENVDKEEFCLHHKYVKNGIVRVKARDKIKEYWGRVYLCKNNLHNFVNETQIYEQFNVWR